jgi:hypothetical protein
MATDTKPLAEASTTELVSGILSDAQDLLKQQFNLFRHEVIDDLRKTREAGTYVGLGAGAALVGSILLTVMLVHLVVWLFPNFPLWGSYAVWSAGAFLVAGVLIYTGMRKFASFNPLPEQSAEALKENVRWITHPK